MKLILLFALAGALALGFLSGAHYASRPLVVTYDLREPVMPVAMPGRVICSFGEDGYGITIHSRLRVSR